MKYFKTKKVRNNKIKRVHIHENKQHIKIKNAVQETWSFEKIGETASNAKVDPSGTKINFGFPKITQTIYPGETARLNSGWNLTELPENTMMHTVPHKELINSNIITIPQILNSTGNELVQVILNNNDFPIRISFQVNEEGEEKHKVYKLVEEYGELEEMLEIDVGNLFSTILGAASNILPFFL